MGARCTGVQYDGMSDCNGWETAPAQFDWRALGTRPPAGHTVSCQCAHLIDLRFYKKYYAACASPAIYLVLSSRDSAHLCFTPCPQNRVRESYVSQHYGDVREQMFDYDIPHFVVVRHASSTVRLWGSREMYWHDLCRRVQAGEHPLSNYDVSQSLLVSSSEPNDCPVLVPRLAIPNSIQTIQSFREPLGQETRASGPSCLRWATAVCGNLRTTFCRQYSKKIRCANFFFLAYEN